MLYFKIYMYEGLQSSPSLESHENEPVTKEQVLNMYAKTLNGKEDGPARDLLIKWTEQNYA